MSDDLVKRLREDADYHRFVAHDCDCRPEDTINWRHAVTADEAANRIEQLEAALRKIAMDEPDCCMIADRMKETAETALGMKDER